MLVKVSIGSYAILGENIEASWVTFAWFGALYADSCSWAVVQSYTAVADFPVVLMALPLPVEIPQVQFLFWW